MKRVTPAVRLLALSLTVSAIAWQQPASSADLSKFIPPSNGIVNIDQRQAQLERRITDAVSAGRLTRAESQSFLDDLDKVAELEAGFKASSNNLSTWENLKLLFQLDTLSRRLEQSLHDRTVSSADLDSRIAELEWRLSDARSSHRLTEQESSEFNYEITRVKLLKNSYTADGVLNDTESMKLALALDTLSRRVESTMHDRQYQLPNIDKFQAELDKRITDGIAAGKIDAKEATELRDEYKRIADREARLRRFGRPLTSVETLELALDLEKLSASIDKFTTTASSVSPDYAKRKGNVEARTSRGLVAGKLTIAEAYQVKEQLTELDTEEKDRSKSEGSLSPSEQKALSVELEKIAAGLERRLADTTKSWPGINEKLDILDRRITAARSKGRLSESEATALGAEWKRISTKWGTYQRTDEDGVYPLNDTLEVATSIERLGQKLSDNLHDRSVEIPKLETLSDQVDDRIAYGVVNSKVTMADAKKFIDEFDGVIAKQMGYQSSGSELDDRERLMVALEFQQLLAKIEKAIKETHGAIGIDELKEQISDQLNDGTASGKLSDAEANYLKGEFARVKALEANYRGSGSKLTGREALTVLQELRTVQTSLRREIQDTEIASTDIDKRASELQVRIATGVTTGKLTQTDASDLRKELARIKAQERDYNEDGGISKGEAATLAYLLEALGAKIESTMSDTHLALPNISRMQEDIDRRLANAVVDGTIGLDQIDQFTDKLEDISRLELSFRYSGDGLSYAESATLKTELDKLNKSIDDVLAGGQRSWTGLDEGIAKTAQRINDGIQSKKLSGDAATSLKSEIDRIQKAKVAFAHSQGGYDLQETESLVKDLDRLNAEVDLRLKGQNFAWSDIDRRQQSVEMQIRSAIKSGKLNNAEAKQVQDELERIKRAKAAFTISDGDLSYFERVSLAGALDRLDDMMKRKTR